MTSRRVARHNKQVRPLSLLCELRSPSTTCTAARWASSPACRALLVLILGCVGDGSMRVLLALPQGFLIPRLWLLHLLGARLAAAPFAFCLAFVFRFVFFDAYAFVGCVGVRSMRVLLALPQGFLIPRLWLLHLLGARLAAAPFAWHLSFGLSSLMHMPSSVV